MMVKAQSIKHWSKTGALLMLALLLMNTAGGIMAQELSDDDTLSLDGDWTLVSFGDPDQPRLILPGSEITISFDLDEGKVSGSAGCNHYFAGFDLGDDTIRFSAAGSTMMACAEAERMEQEQHFLAALGESERYEIVDGQLQITDAGGNILTFVPLQRIGSQDGPAINILSPQNGVAFDSGQVIAISGTGQGLFEGNVVVQVLDATGAVLFEQPTTLTGERVGLGDPGDWAIEWTVAAVPGPFAQIVAWSPSPVDGSRMASDSVVILFSAETPGESG